MDRGGTLVAKILFFNIYIINKKVFEPITYSFIIQLDLRWRQIDSVW